MTRMDVREKLMEIVKKAAYSSLPSNTEDFHLNMFVTNLLSHGVTVQEWIPVSEPPETSGCYLVAGNIRWDGKPMTREAYWNGEDWLSCYDKSNITRRITHWMRSPHPPKGE